jgi:NAD(P)-dependent dehydrogenase (short-subunit alcohol dehydrogenase family)
VRLPDLTAGQPAEHFKISRPSVIRHLKDLETAGLVISQRHGGHLMYPLRTSVVEDMATEVADIAGPAADLVMSGRDHGRLPGPPRPLTPDDTAGVVALLVRDEAGALTGQTITVDGGLAMS